MAKKRLITSALPYVNNIPHLGNLLQVLSADVFARFSRLAGYETLYVCGTDEYGTATETKALEEGISPRALCDRYHAIHSDIYRWFNISFDKFGRTSTPKQTEITQHIFKRLDEAGYISEKTTSQLYCETCSRFLADRYVLGICPSCGYEGARGDQCESCGKLLDPTDLKDPHCGVCGGTPVLKETRHLYIDLPAILPKLKKWMEEASVRGFWARNAIQMTNAWMRDGLKERCITRDLKWGIPVPKEGFTDKVFYVWFDAPIGYISITASHTDDWESWWRNPDEVELFQFIGKDNIPFHTVIFPSSLLGSGEKWTMLHHMSSTEYLNYEGGKFSKSKGVGVFGTDARDTGIPADVYRFYLFYNRPEKSDALFTWKDFQEKVNGELIGNLANLVNRTLTFVVRFYGGTIPESGGDEEFRGEIVRREAAIKELLDHAELRDAFKAVFELSSIGNKAFQDGEPWRMRNENPEKARSLIRDLTYLVRDLGILVSPYMPETAKRIASFFGNPPMEWGNLMGSGAQDLSAVTNPAILFEKLEDERIEALKKRFSGSQKERKAMDEQNEKTREKAVKPEEPAEPLEIQIGRASCRERV
jgi:methionyl-tRNA synthetase